LTRELASYGSARSLAHSIRSNIRIAWKSIDGDLHEAGELIFEPAPADRGTYVTLLMEVKVGKLASAWDPSRAAIRSRASSKTFAT